MKNLQKTVAIFDFRKKVQSPSDLGTVSIRTYVNGKRQFLSTGVRVRSAEWSDRRWVIGRPDASDLNARIRAAIEEVDLSAGTPVHSVRKTAAPFLDWVAEQVALLDPKSTATKRHMMVLRELESWGQIRAWREVNARNISAFLTHLSRRTVNVVVDGRLVARPILQTAVYSYYRSLAKWVHLAQAHDLVSANALRALKVPRGESAQREHLTRAEVEQWLAAEPPYAYLVKARDLFAVQCGTGLAYVDLMEVDFSRVEQAGEFYTLSGVRHKTGKSFFLVLLPFAKEVLDRYGGQLPRLSNQKYNDYLKQVAAYAGIRKRISSHVGRHTYACICLSAGVRIEAVQRTLGHTDIKTTQIYARLVDQDVLAAFSASRAVEK